MDREFDNQMIGRVTDRLSTALEDFTSTTHSPQDLPLQFRAGDYVKIIEDEDGHSDLVVVEVNGIHGRVPRFILEPMDQDTEPSLSPALVARGSHTNLGGHQLNEGHQDIHTLSPCVKAVYDYNPAIMSSRDDAHCTELGFKKGDVLLVLGETDESGLFPAELAGRQGLVPASFVEATSEEPTRIEEDVQSLNHSASTVSVSSYASSEFYAIASNERQLVLERGGYARIDKQTGDDFAAQGERSKLSRAPSFLQRQDHPVVAGSNEKNSLQQSESVAKEEQKGFLQRSRSLINSLRPGKRTSRRSDS